MRRTTHFVLVGAIALAVPIVPFALVGELPGDRWLSAQSGGDALFALAGAALLSADVLLPNPSSIVGTLVGARVGFWPGLAAILAGLTAGQVIAYLLARRFARRGGKDTPAEAPATMLVFLSRPVPVLAEAAVIAAGAAQMPLRPFLKACVAGNALYALVLAANGSTLIPHALVGPGLVIPMLLPAAAWLAWRRFGRTP